MRFLDRLFGRKTPQRTVVSAVTSFPNPLTAEKLLTLSENSEARFESVIAQGKTNSQLVVPALAKALLSDDDKYVRSAAAGYLGGLKGATAEKALLQAMADPDPYVRKRVVEALFRLGTKKAQKAVDSALGDPDPEVRAEAEKYATKATRKIAKRVCPFLSETGMCEPPGVAGAHECSWEILGRGHHRDCFVYKMHTHPGGPADFLRRNL